jgi:hypothetical protein
MSREPLWHGAQRHMLLLKCLATVTLLPRSQFYYNVPPAVTKLSATAASLNQMVRPLPSLNAGSSTVFAV